MNTSELIRTEARLRKRLHGLAYVLYGLGVLVATIGPWVTGIATFITSGLLLAAVGTGVWGYASIRYHGRSIDEAYRLGYDLGYEIGWHAKEFEAATNGDDERPLAPRRAR